ncbi:hypothetical protein [Bacteroides sp. 519]|uniref:hypothetical protein n=1 Tax=Bacteroides sp. 519 TaxID=2302937 RepID=UPI0013D6CB01|nr:hypothetical protein [Bacteroides sp. 519]NDV58688.1 hypothetical protein [Bacteroides sp. 519]
MPYRRLPNTDQARIRALTQAVEKGADYDIHNLVISLASLSDARNFLRKFVLAQSYYKQCFDNQAQSSKQHQPNVKMARLYVSHFIQVLNMAVQRSEIKVSYKEWYGLPLDNYNVPDLMTESAIAEWGEKIIAGEQKRISHGGTPIYNPAIAKVKVHYDIFMEGYHRQKNLQSITSRSLERLAEMRPVADELILGLWNQIEKKFEDIEPNEVRLDKCREYGVIYYYRANEKRKMNLSNGLY